MQEKGIELASIAGTFRNAARLMAAPPASRPAMWEMHLLWHSVLLRESPGSPR